MIKINCQYSYRNSLCKNIKVKRGFFGFGPRICIEYGTSRVCEFKRQYKKPPATPPPPPKNSKGLRLYCHTCKGLIRDPGALLFSPPSNTGGITVRKYHLCRRCYGIIISSIETGSLFFGNNREN